MTATEVEIAIKTVPERVGRYRHGLYKYPEMGPQKGTKGSKVNKTFLCLLCLLWPGSVKLFFLFLGFLREHEVIAHRVARGFGIAVANGAVDCAMHLGRLL